jgi:DNA-binding transcriptional LysR family regulator
MHEVELRQLRCLVAIVDEGTFTDAALALGVSQAAVSRALASLEHALGVRLLRRTSREVTPTGTGLRVVAHARRVLAEADRLVRDATSGPARLRVGYAWSALGRHTLTFRRHWRARHPEADLHLIRVHSATAGLLAGACDVAVLRTPVDDRHFASAVVGLERCLAALSADDPLAAHPSLRLADIGGRTVLTDQDTRDVDDWLTAVAAGRGIGVTAEATAHQYPRPGVVYRPVSDAEPVAVRLAWWRDDPHPATGAVVELLVSLYGQNRRQNR